MKGPQAKAHLVCSWKALASASPASRLEPEAGSRSAWPGLKQLEARLRLAARANLSVALVHHSTTVEFEMIT